ncbi:hypothetical protein BGY98DRAFT_628590 [Russula aff. rugulosa BPL654]|nr:hypothetical protein BGY98DRAFT_628590 [Russula aff. rugulosa BPL654]
MACEELEIPTMIVVANDIFMPIDSALPHSDTYLNSTEFLNPEHSQGRPLSQWMASVSSRLLYLWRLGKMEAGDDRRSLVYPETLESDVSRSTRIALCLLPRLVILHVADMLFNRATNVSNLLPFSLSLTQRLRPCPAVTVASWVGLSKTDAIFPTYPSLRASAFPNPHPTTFDLSFGFL